jgi:protein-disulfide isomerase
MKLTKTTVVLIALALMAAPAFARKKDKEKAAAPAAAPAAAAAATMRPAATTDATTAATVGGEPITIDQLDEQASSELMRIRQQEYQIRLTTLQSMIQDRLLADEAKARGVDEAALLKTEVVDKSPAVTDDDAQKFYDTNKARMGGRSFDDTKADILKMLAQQKQSARRGEFLSELQAKADVKILLDPPRVVVKLPDTAPTIGPADAPITMIEWSDYQCPFCKRAHPVVQQVLDEYKDKIRFAYLDYPLPFHQHAMPASEAAHCASDQGKFWEYHKNLFEVAGDLSEADLNKRATDLGLDGTAFSSCMESKKNDPLIQSNMSSGQAVGVTGTPAFFINGRMLVGAQPIEQFRQVINDELTHKGIPVPSVSSAAAKAATAGTN